MSKPILAIIEDLVAYRDRITDRADRDMLADVANALSSLNAKAEHCEKHHVRPKPEVTG